MMKNLPLLVLSTLYASQVLAFDLPKQVIKSYECQNCSQLSHETLTDSWSITDSVLKTKPSNKQKSYSYRKEVTINQLHKGVKLSTTAPGAVIRITPIQNQSMPSFKLITPSKKQLSLIDASLLYKADDDNLKAADHQSLLQLDPKLGKGNFILKTDDSINSGSFLISLFDKYSPSYLEISTDSLRYHYGDTVTAIISLKTDLIDYEIEDINAFLLGPKKQVISMTLKELSPNVFEATAIINSEDNDQGENWYVEADVSGDVGGTFIRRNGHAGFSYSIPSATLVSIEKNPSSPLSFTAKVEVATASRFSLQSILYKKDSKGNPSPLKTNQIAQWLEPGKHEIQFSFDNIEQIAEDSLYLGYLRLIDYGQLKTVYQYDDPIALNQLGPSVAN